MLFDEAAGNTRKDEHMSRYVQVMAFRHKRTLREQKYSARVATDLQLIFATRREDVGSLSKAGPSRATGSGTCTNMKVSLQ